MSERLEFVAGFKDNISAGAKKAGKALEAIRPSHGMAQANKWMETFHKGTDRTVGAIRPMAGMLNSVGVGGLAASLSMGELVKQFKELSDSTLNLRELSRQSRISAADLQRLEYVGSKFRIDPKAMDSAVGAWSGKMVEFKMHVGDFYTYLMRQNAGVAAKINRDNPIDALKDTIEYLSRIKDPQIQKRVADMAGLGDIVPVLGKGPDGVAAAFAEAAREVKPVTKELQEAADRFNDSTVRFNQTWANFKTDLGPSVLDPLSHTLDKLDEGMKWAAKYPGDAAAAAATIAGSFGAFWLRAKIMRGSMLAGGGGAAGKAAGEMVGAAQTQRVASTTFAEAVAEFRVGVREMIARGGVPGPGGAPVERTKPGAPSVVEETPKGGFLGRGGWKGVGGSVMEGVIGAMIYQAGEQAMDAVLGWTAKDQKTLDHATSLSNVIADVREQWFGGGSGTSAASLYRAYDGQGGRQPTSTLSPEDYWARKNAYLRGRSPFHPDDDRASRATAADMPAHELFKTVREGSKEGIVAGLREMAQQQELNGKGGDGGPGGTLGAAARVLGKAGVAVGARPRASSGFTPAEGGGTTHAKGNLAANQREAYAAALKEGLSPTAARALVANMSGEGLGNPKDYHWDSTHMASGIVQWDPTRSARIKAQFGAMPHQLSVADQTRAAIWEMKTRPEYAASWRALQGDNAAEMIGALVDNYERPKLRALPKAQRMGYYRGFNPDAQATPGAGTPAPSGAAVTDAQVFGARQRMLNGGRDPADRALVDRYKAQQAKPEKHRAGGWIRGRGTGTSDSIPAWLSNGEFVVNARASGQWLPFLHAINGGHLPGFADGGPVGFGVDKRFYPKFTPAISADEGHANRQSWLDFFQRPSRIGGMGASRSVALGATAMMNGETGWNLNSNSYGWDVNGPSGGAAQWHDVTVGRWAGKLHRLSDLMTFAMQQHADWHDRTVQQAFWKKEATSSLSGAWHAMRLARMASGTLRHGIDLFENPADHEGELRRRLPNIAKLAREDAGAVRTANAGPVQIDIRHHPHTGRPIIQAKVGRGVKLGIRTAPTMRAS